jgi:hypothetical protein
MTKDIREVPEIDERAMLEYIANQDYGGDFLNHPAVQKKRQVTDEDTAVAAFIDAPATSEQRTIPIPTEEIAQTESTKKASGKQRKASLEEFRQQFMQTPKIDDRKPVFISLTTRNSLDRIVRLFGERGMSVSGLVENLVNSFLETYKEDVEQWRKM